MADALQSYQNQMADMSTSYHNQLADAAQALSNSLADAATALNNKMADIMKSMLDSLRTINSALAGLGVKGVAGGSAYSPSTTPKYGTYGSSGTGAGYGVTYGPGIGAVSPAAPIIGSLTQNVYTTDPSLPTITTGLTNAISVGQTQGLMTKTPVVSTQR
jgi:hypothetical protein